MPKAKRKTNKPAVEHEYIAVTIDKYEISTRAGINYEALDTKSQHDDVRIYDFSTNIEIEGTIDYPDARKGHRQRLTIYTGDFEDTLNDHHVLDKDGNDKYSNKRGGCKAMYDPPKWIGLMDKVRGELAWQGHVSVSPQSASNMLTLFSQPKQLYLAIDEFKENKYRFIRHVSLQTNDAAE